MSVVLTDLAGPAGTGGDSGDIDDGSVTLAKLADLATDTFIGRDTAGTGVPEALSVATVKTMLGVATGAALVVDTDGTLAANSDANTATQKAVKTYADGVGTTTLAAAQTYADGLVVGLVDDRGNYDASGNVFPSSGGSGTAGAVLKGDLWTISVAGTLGGHPVTAGDLVRALTNTPGQTDVNWAITENNIGYVAENASNKVTSISGASTDTQYGSAKLLFDQLALKSALAGSASIVTVGTLGTGTWQATAVAAPYGGTGQTVYAVGDILYASTTSALSKLAGVATGNALISGGLNTAPSYGKIGLTTHISGILAGTNGGTGVNNGSNTVTLAANFVTSGANSLTLTTTGATNVTLPTSGTLATTAISPVGLHQQWIAADELTSRTTNGALAAVTTINSFSAATLAFDSATSEGATKEIVLPKSWNAGTITAQFYWSHPSTTVNFGVVWAAEFSSSTDADSITINGTPQSAADTGGSTDLMYVTAATPAITVDGAPGKGHILHLEVTRVVSDGNDTMAVDARLHGVLLTYTTDAATDA